VPPLDLPAQEAVFAPDYAPEEIAEIARRLRNKAGLPDEPTGVVANDTNGIVDKVKEAVS
jgi:Mn-containing catalase